MYPAKVVSKRYSDRHGHEHRDRERDAGSAFDAVVFSVPRVGREAPVVRGRVVIGRALVHLGRRHERPPRIALEQLVVGIRPDFACCRHDACSSEDSSSPSSSGGMGVAGGTTDVSHTPIAPMAPPTSPPSAPRERDDAPTSAMSRIRSLSTGRSPSSVWPTSLRSISADKSVMPRSRAMEAAMTSALGVSFCAFMRLGSAPMISRMAFAPKVSVEPFGIPTTLLLKTLSPESLSLYEFNSDTRLLLMAASGFFKTMKRSRALCESLPIATRFLSMSGACTSFKSSALIDSTSSVGSVFI